MASMADLPYETDRFLRLVGRAITEWASVEEELFQTVLFVLGGSRQHSAIIYYRTPNLDARMSLTDELVEALFPDLASGDHQPDAFKRWKKIVEDLKRELKIRNQLAHCPATPILNIPEGKKEGFHFDVDISYASYTSRTESLRGRKKDNRRALVAEDIEKHLKKVSELINHLRNFFQADLPNLVVNFRQREAGIGVPAADFSRQVE